MRRVTAVTESRTGAEAARLELQIALATARAATLCEHAARAVARANAVRESIDSQRRFRAAAAEARRRQRLAELETLVRDNRALAQRLAAHFASRGQPLEDLEQVAYIGLVTAARRFDPERGVRFATFARATIVGELKKYFRDHAWTVHVPRPVQETYLAVRGATEDLTQELGRSPTPDELAKRVGSDVEDVIEALDAASALHVDSLDRPAGDEEGDRPTERGVEEYGFARIEDRAWLVPALATLPERERTILRLRFFDGHPQSAIASRVGISQMHVSRLLARSLAQLRSMAPPA